MNTLVGEKRRCIVFDVQSQTRQLKELLRKMGKLPLSVEESRGKRKPSERNLSAFSKGALLFTCQKRRTKMSHIRSRAMSAVCHLAQTKHDIFAEKYCYEWGIYVTFFVCAFEQIVVIARRARAFLNTFRSKSADAGANTLITLAPEPVSSRSSCAPNRS